MLSVTRRLRLQLQSRQMRPSDSFSLVSRRHARLAGVRTDRSSLNAGSPKCAPSCFAQKAPNDSTQAVGDVLLREELFAKPLPWLQFAVGADLRLNSHDQVEDEWRVDVSDRGVRRPRLSLRRATATIAYRKLTLDVGKQFIRWGKTDILNPTDRFAPRDYLNVVDTEFLPVTGVRASVQATDQDSFEVRLAAAFHAESHSAARPALDGGSSRRAARADCRRRRRAADGLADRRPLEPRRRPRGVLAVVLRWIQSPAEHRRSR